MIKEKDTAEFSAVLGDAEREVLQKALDAYCEKLMSDYDAGWESATLAFLKSVSAFKALQEYPVCGTAPHEQAFLSRTEQLIQRLRGAMRQLRGIYDTLGLRTNYPLYRVLGYTSQGRKHEPQAV